MSGETVAAAMTAARFWRSVDVGKPDECWTWRLATTGPGYGVFHPSKGTTEGAHRFALALALGRPLLPKTQACHRCDNPPCVNPAHLFEGTNADNVRDMVSKGRQARGSMKSSLREIDVLEMREAASTGVKLSDLAEAFDVSQALVTGIVRGQRWTHVGGPITNTYRKAAS